VVRDGVLPTLNGWSIVAPTEGLPLWKPSVPPEFQDRQWDFARFRRGERFVYEVAREALPAWRDALSDPSSDVRRCAQCAIAMIR
jgi:hypothetical protein